MSQPGTLNRSNLAPLGKTDSQSSDYFDDDPGFAEALATLDDTALFGSQPLACLDNISNSLLDSNSKPSSQGRKRKRSPSPLSGQENSQEEAPTHYFDNEPKSSINDPATDTSTLSRQFPTVDPGSPATFPDTYDASKFGGLRDYKRRKRAKLQNQNTDIVTQDKRSSQSTLFKSLAIYITGRTNPSLQVLRALLVQHGGQFHAYLDRKEMVTHIITNNLTPVKALEFKHMKVVRPDWLLDSVAANKLLPWSDYKWVPQAGGPSQLHIPDTPRPTPSTAPTLSSPQNVLNKTSPGSIPEVKAIEMTTNSLLRPEPTQSTFDVTQPAVASSPSVPPVSEPIIARRLFPSLPMPPPAAPAGPSRPPYAKYTSNPEAERLMESAEWREAHTAASGETYIQGFYQHSRLHHLSKWKAELRSLVFRAQEAAEAEASSGSRSSVLSVDLLNSRRKEKGKGRATDKVIMHCDFDSFFVAAGIIARPELEGKPVVVCHASGKGTGHSTSEIASASYAARAFGIKNGMSLGQARKLCPEIQTIPYEFERYKELSLKFYTILMTVSDDLQAVSVDEALIDVTNAVEALRAQALESGQLQSESYEKQMAERIRDKVRAATACEISVGIGPNIMLARLATKRAKPAGSFYLSVTDAPSHIIELDIVDLHGFASAVRDKAIASFGTSKLRGLAGERKSSLQKALGDKCGERVWNAIRGVDDRILESDKPRKSVSADVNYGIRFENDEHTEKFIYGLGREVSDRLKSIGKRGRSLTLKIMKRHPDAPKEAPKFMGHGKCETFSKTCSISGVRGSATDDPNAIGREAWKLLQSMAFDPKELRGIGIQIHKLDEAHGLAVPRGAVQGQLAMRFQQAAAKFSRMNLPASSNVPRPDLPPLAPEVTVIDVDALDDSQSFKPPPGRKETPYDLTMLSQLTQNTVAKVMNCGTDRARSLSVPRILPPASGSPKAASLSPRRAVSHKRLTNMGPPTIVPRQPQFFPIFSRQFAPVPDQELVSLDIDPMYYAQMSKEDQKVLVFARRASKGLDGAGRPVYKRKRRLQEPLGGYVYKTVQAAKTELPTLRTARPGSAALTETGDIQDMMRSWVETKVAKKLGPDAREVAHFSGFLEKSMATDRGMQRTVEIMKWWRRVCMDSWGQEYERRGQYGHEWWTAWWNIKDSLDVIVKSRFGGKLNLN